MRLSDTNEKRETMGKKISAGMSWETKTRILNEYKLAVFAEWGWEDDEDSEDAWRGVLRPKGDISQRRRRQAFNTINGLSK
jgi:hypothetical protein